MLEILLNIAPSRHVFIKDGTSEFLPSKMIAWKEPYVLFLDELNIPNERFLYDKTLHNISAEAIYDIITNEMRKFKKLETFRGYIPFGLIEEVRALAMPPIPWGANSANSLMNNFHHLRNIVPMQDLAEGKVLPKIFQEQVMYYKKFRKQNL